MADIPNTNKAIVMEGPNYYYNVYEISHGHIFKIIVNIHVGSGSRKYSFYLFTADANLHFFANFRKSDGFVSQLKLMKIVTTASRTYLN